MLAMFLKSLLECLMFHERGLNEIIKQGFQLLPSALGSAFRIDAQLESV
jgi:hypothetical protein